MSFESDIEKASKLLDITVAKMVRVLSLYIFGGIVRKTPVDKGYLRAAWNISLGEPVFITTPGVQGSKDLPEEVGFYPTIYITNGLPYAAVVEYGLYTGIGPKTEVGSNPTTGGGIFSLQAPAGMVEVTLVDVQMNLRKIVNN